jgi:hypothetical protein
VLFSNKKFFGFLNVVFGHYRNLSERFTYIHMAALYLLMTFKIKFCVSLLLYPQETKFFYQHQKKNTTEPVQERRLVQIEVLAATGTDNREMEVFPIT